MTNTYTKRIGHWVISSFAIFAFSVMQNASAHTTVVPSSLDEGDRVFADLSISHGCDGKPVRATGTVFPSKDSLLEKVGEPNVPVNFEDHLIVGRHAAARLSQDKDIFRKMEVTSAGDTTSFHWRKGYLQTDLTGQVPFRYSAPTFKDSSCAKQVDILIPIVNWCSRSRTAPDRADVWMGRLTEKFNDPDIQPVGFWPKITVHRNMVANPFTNEKCGEGMDLEWSPTDAEIDELLPLRRYWPANLSR